MGNYRYYDSRSYPIDYKKKKTPKQKEKIKKLNSQLDKLNKQVDVIDKDKSALETLEEKIAVKEKNYGQEFLDFKEMSDKDFEKTYNMSRKDWARLNGKEYKEQ